MNLPSDRKLTAAELRAWLDRPPPGRPPDERAQEEFELVRVGHTCMVTADACENARRCS